MLRTVQLSHETMHTGCSRNISFTNLRRSGATAFRFADCRGIGLRLKFSGVRVSCLVLRVSIFERGSEALRRSGARRFSGISVPSKLTPHSGAFTCKYRTLLGNLEVTP